MASFKRAKAQAVEAPEISDDITSTIFYHFKQILRPGLLQDAVIQRV